MDCIKALFKQTFRFVLFILNIVLILFSLGLAILGVVYVVINARDTDTTSGAVPLKTNFFTFGCAVAICMGLCIFLICILTGFYCGIYKQRRLCLLMYSVLVLVAGVLVLVVGLLMVTIHSKGRKDSMTSNFKSYEEHKKYLETIQKRYRCCGPYPEALIVDFGNIKHCDGDSKRTDCATALDDAYKTNQTNLGVVLIVAALLTIACGVFGLIVWRLMRKSPPPSA